MHNFQSMMPLEEDLSNIEKFYNLGLRQMNFTYNIDTPYADGGVSNYDDTVEGVSELGEKAIREMNRRGIAVDASYSSNKTAIQAAMLTDNPMMLSQEVLSV